jgi:hypothetical protein
MMLGAKDNYDESIQTALILHVENILLDLKTTNRIIVAIHYGGEGSQLMHHVEGYIVFSNMHVIRCIGITDTDSYYDVYVCSFEHDGIFSLSYASELHEYITGILFDCIPTSIDALFCGAMSVFIADDFHIMFRFTRGAICFLPHGIVLITMFHTAAQHLQ